MPARAARRIMMISIHGYVAGQAEMGLPDTGGQVVYVLRLSECLARLGYRVDIYTRRFEDQPAIESLGERVRIVRIPCGGPQLIRKEWMCDVIPRVGRQCGGIHRTPRPRLRVHRQPLLGCRPGR